MADRPGATGAARRAGAGWHRPGLAYLLLLPALALELLVHLVPMAVGVWMSFRELTQFYIRNWAAAPWAGLRNFRVALDVDSAIGASLLRSLWITLAYALLVVAGSWLLGFVAALLLQRPMRSRGLLRTLFLVPYALPAYAAVIAWNFLLQRDNGMLNHLLVENLHLTDDRAFWLLGDRSFVAVVLVSVWRHWPFAFLIIMAGMQNIPTDLYEAAAIDGAGPGQQIRRVTLPMLRPVNLVLVLVLFLWTFNDFTTPFVLFGAATPDQADLISVHIYQSSFVTWNFGLGSAMSVLLLLFLLLLTTGYLLLTARRRRRAV
ncbi:sugar ABC transporter permease [Plantactinospora sp. KLBMP9567]|uniref:carbohydrate ABC transporter permease n=1 Tax=Plantactinospora sp. KLBMP9567 TaxID=3085900 RepID=UPI0029827A6B|nr:sugar ABC transporter permease [Plantactinospora sp. KLBMP9567]MDW5323660.1 sugar ABC transporter permease [Plantactinospora sp. KLBMP9567]